MITNNVDFLQRVILSMAEEQYNSEIVDTCMEDVVIGPDRDEVVGWGSKEEWMSDFISEHFNKAKISIIDNPDTKVKNVIMTPENTIAMRMYSLDVGESFDFDNFNRIIRFPGGWGFKSSLSEAMMFIPFNSEFCVEHGILAKEFKKLNDKYGELIDEKRSEVTI
jgi:hypothetical protein